MGLGTGCRGKDGEPESRGEEVPEFRRQGPGKGGGLKLLLDLRWRATMGVGYRILR